MATSENGWPAITRGNDPRLTVIRPLPGRAFRIHKDTAAIFTWLIQRFDAEVESVTRGQLDDWSYAYRKVRAGRNYSNHASGTAIDLNATKHPLGQEDTFNQFQRQAIHRIIHDCREAIRWGGDYSGRKDDMHFEIRPGWSAARLKALIPTLAPPRPPRPGDRLIWDGAEGDDVRWLQQRLGLEPDGGFGPVTDQAVRELQDAHDLDVDGMVGQDTWDILLQPDPQPKPTPPQPPSAGMESAQGSAKPAAPTEPWMHLPITRQGSKLGGTTTVHAVLGWYDHGQEKNSAAHDTTHAKLDSIIDHLERN